MSTKERMNSICQAIEPATLLGAAKETREACAAFMRVLAANDLVSEGIAEAKRAGITEGFGVRLQQEIAKAEEKVKGTHLNVEDLDPVEGQWRKEKAEEKGEVR